MTKNSQVAEGIASSTVAQSCGEVAQTLVSSSGIPFAGSIGVLVSSATSSVVEEVVENFNEKTDGKKVDKGILERAAATVDDWAEVVGGNIKKFVNGQETSLGKDFEEFAARHAIEDADIENIKTFVLKFGKDLATGAAITVAVGAAVAAAPVTFPAAAVGVASIIANIAANKILDEAGDVVGQKIEEVSGCKVGELVGKAVDEAGKTFDSMKHSVESTFHDLTGFGEDSRKHVAPTAEAKHHHSFVEDVANRGHNNSNTRG